MLLKSLFESKNSQTAVLGWGRGMGHKGHMLLAKAVLHHAQSNNAKPFFVVSRTSLVDPSTGQPWADKPTFTKTKDDPLTPEEKLATYRKVFPQNAEVFSVATADATKLEQVIAKIAQEGFNKVILVVGEDQKQSMAYLTRPDKSGVPPYKQAGLEDLEIISRQDTTEPSSMRGSPEYQEGPRATPMRQVLTDPSKSEEEQFAVWRRDMPDDLSDAEVLDLMRKAKQRMSMVPQSKNKKVQELDEKPKRSWADYGMPDDTKPQQPKQYHGWQEYEREMQRRKEQRQSQQDRRVGEGEAKYDADYDDMVKRVGKLAKEGPRKTVWDPKTRKYKTVPVNPTKDVKESESKVIKHTVKSLENPPKVMQHRAKRDQEREQQLKYRDIAKRDDKLKEKIKGADGKACWDGYRYNGSENGKDKCVKVSEDVENKMASLIKLLENK